MPSDWTKYLSPETYKLLDHAGVYPDTLKDSEPHNWFQKILARKASRPPYIDISEDGSQTLRNEPSSLEAGADED